MASGAQEPVELLLHLHATIRFRNPFEGRSVHATFPQSQLLLQSGFDRVWCGQSSATSPIPGDGILFFHRTPVWHFVDARETSATVSQVVRTLLLCFAATASFVAASFVSSAAEGADDSVPRRPNVILLVSDDQRPDTIHALGNGLIDTPNLDWLTKNGTAFTRATCANPICTPSRAEILTGQSGFHNGVVDFGGRFRAGTPFLAKSLKQAGYHCGYVGKWHNAGVPADCGYDETVGWYGSGGARWAVPSFDWYGRPVTGYRGWLFKQPDGSPMPEKGVGLTSNISANFANAALRFIREPRDQPYFLHVNFTAPHDPLLLPIGFENRYSADELPLPGNFRSRHPFDHGNIEGRDERLLRWPRTVEEVRDELAVYYAVISHLDQQIGRILAELRRSTDWENTIVIFTSDHGLAIGSHGLRGKQNMYEHTIGVPLIMVGPGIPADQRISAQCYLRDLFPTICELAAVPIPDAVDGRSLMPLVNGMVKSIYPHVFGYFRNVQRMVRTERWKLIHYPEIDRTQLFDLESDPLEMRNLAEHPDQAGITANLRNVLRDWQDSVNDPADRISAHGQRKSVEQP